MFTKMGKHKNTLFKKGFGYIFEIRVFMGIELANYDLYIYFFRR